MKSPFSAPTTPVSTGPALVAARALTSMYSGVTFGRLASAPVEKSPTSDALNEPSSPSVRHSRTVWSVSTEGTVTFTIAPPYR